VPNEKWVGGRQSQSGHFAEEIDLCTIFLLGDLIGLGYVEGVSRRIVLKLA
jgi:hypothetical protein